MPPHPTHSHQEALKNLFMRLQAFIQQHNLGVSQLAPLPVRLWPGKIREPDILFVAKEHSNRIAEQVYGVPDLVVEVISPHTRRTDRVEKFVEYARAGVSEYWLVDPQERTIEIYILKEGAYELLGKYNPGEIAQSHILAGFQVAASDIFLE